MTGARDGQGARGLTTRTVVTAALGTSFGVLPPFLLGAMSFQVRPHLGFSESALGAAIALFFALSAISSVPAGRMTERFGAKRGMLLAAIATAICLSGIGALARTWWHLLVFLAIGGAGMALSASASSLSVARLIAPHRQGVAYGASKAAGPAATMFAGFAVPAIALTIGWRWAFVCGGVAALSVFLIVPDDVAVHRRRPPQQHAWPDASRTALVILAVAVGFGIGGANSMAAFFVESAVFAGFDPGLAGFALAVGSICGLVARVLWGWIADVRTSGRLHLLAILMFVGGVGMFLLAFVRTPVQLVIVAIVVFAAAWGWTGLFTYVVVRVSPRAPAAAVGVVSSGMFAGGTVGPLLFGAAAQRGSYLLMWTIGLVALIIAGTLAEIALMVIRRERRAEADA